MVDIIIFLIIFSALIKTDIIKTSNDALNNILKMGSTYSSIIVFFITYFIILKKEQKEYMHFIENRRVSFIPKKVLVYLSSTQPDLDEYVLFLLVSTNVIPFKNYIQYIVNKINSGHSSNNAIDHFILKRLIDFDSYAYSEDETVSQEFVDSFIVHHKIRNSNLKNSDVFKNQTYKKENKDFEEQIKDTLLTNGYVFRRKGSVLLATKKSSEIAADIMACVNHLYSENKLNSTEPYKTLFKR